MNRIVGAFLKQFGPTGGSTPPAPNVPTFTVADNGDGTGGVVTIAGSSAGSVNTFYAAPWSAGGVQPTSLGSRVGDGTLAIAAAAGRYLGHVRSVLNSQSNVSLTKLFTLTAPVTALGSLSISIEGIRSLLAASATFAARVGAVSAGDALQKIYRDAAVLDDDEQTLDSIRPFAVVCEADHGYEQNSEGDGIGMGAAGSLVLLLTDTARLPDNHDASKLDFTNFVGQTIDEMAELSGHDTYFPVVRFRMIQRSIRSPRSTKTDDHDYWWAQYLCEFEVGV